MPRTNHAMVTGPGLLDIDAVAEQLAVTPRHIRRLVAERRLPYLKVGRFIRVDPGELESWRDGTRRPELRALRYRASGE
jgi:excisionase family DNA binding protein